MYYILCTIVYCLLYIVQICILCKVCILLFMYIVIFFIYCCLYCQGSLRCIHYMYNYSWDHKAEISAAINFSQSSVSHCPLEIILICTFCVKKYFVLIIISAENNCAA